MLSLLYLRVQAQQYFVTSSYMFLDEKTVLEIWLNLGLNLTIFRGTRPRTLDLYAWVEALQSCCFLQWTCIPTRQREVAFFDALCC